MGGRQHPSRRIENPYWRNPKHTPYSRAGFGPVASTTTSTNSANERDAAATVRTTRSLLAIHGVQSWTVANEQAWGRTPAEVGSIFYFLYFNFRIIYFCIYLHLKNSKKYKIQKI